MGQRPTRQAEDCRAKVPQTIGREGRIQRRSRPKARLPQIRNKARRIQRRSRPKARSPQIRNKARRIRKKNLEKNLHCKRWKTSEAVSQQKRQVREKNKYKYNNKNRSVAAVGGVESVEKSGNLLQKRTERNFTQWRVERKVLRSFSRNFHNAQILTVVHVGCSKWCGNPGEGKERAWKSFKGVCTACPRAVHTVSTGFCIHI